MTILIAYIAALISLMGLDAIWILNLGKKFYNDHLGFLFAKNANFVPVMFFYPIYALAVVVLVVGPALDAESWLAALGRGALLGLAAFAAYDLTNQATIAGWPTIVTFVDIGWGVLATSLASTIAYAIARRF